MGWAISATARELSKPTIRAVVAVALGRDVASGHPSNECSRTAKLRQWIEEARDLPHKNTLPFEFFARNANSLCRENEGLATAHMD